MPEPQPFRMDEEERMIPVWSIIAASLAFVLVEYYFWDIAPGQRHHQAPPLGMRIYLDLTWGALAALYFLMVGYISKDAPRRAMSTWFWMFICIVAPPGIGAVLYFLLRQPIVSRCPACGTQVQGDFHFCPQCNYQLAANCGNCYRTVRATDLFCTRCGHELAEDQTPARLRVMSE
jgi:hypothetical protein